MWMAGFKNKTKTIIIIKTHTLALAGKKRTARCGWQDKKKKSFFFFFFNAHTRFSE